MHSHRRGSTSVLCALVLLCGGVSALATAAVQQSSRILRIENAQGILLDIDATSSLSTASVHQDLQKMRTRAQPHHGHALPLVAERSFQAFAEKQRAILEEGCKEGAKPKQALAPVPSWPWSWLTRPDVIDERGRVFEAVEVSLPLEPPILKYARDTGGGQGDKNIVGLQELTRGGRGCIVYGLGIADDSGFEQQMQELGCETHAFDCTVDPKATSVAGQSFKFHNWCIGQHGKVNMQESAYVNTSDASLKFKTLSETMQELGHTYIDLLKFDIEGFEWQLFETEILKSANPPEQLSFELHTQQAYRGFVPHENVEGAGYVQVNRLFRSLYDMGYRVTSKQLNNGDPACAEFVVVNVNRGDACP